MNIEHFGSHPDTEKMVKEIAAARYNGTYGRQENGVWFVRWEPTPAEIENMKEWLSLLLTRRGEVEAEEAAKGIGTSHSNAYWALANPIYTLEEALARGTSTTLTEGKVQAAITLSLSGKSVSDGHPPQVPQQMGFYEWRPQQAVPLMVAERGFPMNTIIVPAVIRQYDLPGYNGSIDIVYDSPSAKVLLDTKYGRLADVRVLEVIGAPDLALGRYAVGEVDWGQPLPRGDIVCVRVQYWFE